MSGLKSGRTLPRADRYPTTRPTQPDRLDRAPAASAGGRAGPLPAPGGRSAAVFGVAGALLLTLVATGCAALMQQRGPTFVAGTAPAYPDAARAAGVEGHVVVRYRISISGDVVAPQVVESEPAGVFDAAALAAVRQWHFQPPVRGGAPQEAPAVQSKLIFRLGDPDVYAAY